MREGREDRSRKETDNEGEIRGGESEERGEKEIREGERKEIA